MKYTVTFDVPDKPVMKQAHFFVPEPVYREFAFIAKQQHKSMSQVIVEFMRHFAAQYYGRDNKQPEMF